MDKGIKQGVWIEFLQRDWVMECGMMMNELIYCVYMCDFTLMWCFLQFVTVLPFDLCRKNMVSLTCFSLWYYLLLFIATGVVLVGETSSASAFLVRLISGLILQKDPSFLWSIRLPIFRFHRNHFYIFKHDESRFSNKIGFLLDRQLCPEVTQLRLTRNALVPLLLCTYNRTHISLTHCLPCLISKPLGEYGLLMDPTECCVGVCQQFWTCDWKFEWLPSSPSCRLLVFTYKESKSP